MKTRILNIFVLLLLIISLFAFILGSVKPCSSQFFAFDPFVAPINPFLYPAYPFPLVPPVPTVPLPTLNPLLSLPTLPRTAAATVIVLPPAAPAVTAYAPLGTLTLTPSTLVFLILYLTLAE